MKDFAILRMCPTLMRGLRAMCRFSGFPAPTRKYVSFRGCCMGRFCVTPCIENQNQPDALVSGPSAPKNQTTRCVNATHWDGHIPCICNILIRHPEDPAMYYDIYAPNFNGRGSRDGSILGDIQTECWLYEMLTSAIGPHHTPFCY